MATRCCFYGLSHSVRRGLATNYSSARASLIEFRRWAETIQYGLVVPQILTPVWTAFVRMAVIAGLFPGRSVEELLPVDWLLPGFSEVDAEKEIAADVAAVNAGFKSRAQVVAERGYSLEEIDADLAADTFRPTAKAPAA